jgi:hypothetical protein
MWQWVSNEPPNLNGVPAVGQLLNECDGTLCSRQDADKIPRQWHEPFVLRNACQRNSDSWKTMQYLQAEEFSN